MTKFQAFLAGVFLIVAGIALVLIGTFYGKDFLVGLGVGLITSGCASLGIPRPQDTQ